MTGEDRLKALGLLARQQREDLELTLNAVADAAGISRTTLLNVEQGRPVRGITYSKFEPVIGWVKGSCRAFLNTGKLPDLAVDLTGRTSDGRSFVAEVKRQDDASPEEHIAILHRWADNDSSLSDEQRRDFQTLIRLAEERIAKRRAPRRKQA